MAQRNNDPARPHPAANMEQAEGSRETVTGPGHDPRDDDAADGEAGGITNRDLEREQAEQQRVPPRGESRDDTP